MGDVPAERRDPGWLGLGWVGSGVIGGAAAVVLAGVVAATGLVYLGDGFPLWLVATAALAGVLAWAAMLRPALWVRDERLVMRNMLETIQIRLVAVEELAVRQVLAVRALGRIGTPAALDAVRRLYNGTPEAPPAPSPSPAPQSCAPVSPPLALEMRHALGDKGP